MKRRLNIEHLVLTKIHIAEADACSRELYLLCQNSVHDRVVIDVIRGIRNRGLYNGEANIVVATKRCLFEKYYGGADHT